MANGKKDGPDHARLDKIVADARRAQNEREHSYRGQALKLYPWICGRCGREFTQTNVRELTVHHKDHNHDNNPPDGSIGNCSASTATTTNTSGTAGWQGPVCRKSHGPVGLVKERLEPVRF